MLNELAFWYQVIVASEPLLDEAIYLLKDDGFEGELKAFYRHHLEDERHHAKWLKEDLGDHPISLHFTAAALAGTAYYLIRHSHPVALMGYMQALEGRPIDPAVIDLIVAQHGEKAARTVRIHAENDPEHIKELLAFPIPEEHRALVEATRTQTLRFLQGLQCQQ